MTEERKNIPLMLAFHSFECETCNYRFLSFFYSCFYIPLLSLPDETCCLHFFIFFTKLIFPSLLPSFFFFSLRSRHVLAQLLPESSISDSLKMLRALRSFVVAISRREMGVPAPAEMCYKDNLVGSLGRFFPTAGLEPGADHHDLYQMVHVIEEEYCNSCVVPVSWLFSLDGVAVGSNQMQAACRADERCSVFVESALEFFLQGSCRYSRQLLNLLRSMNPAGDGKLTPSMCEYCLHHVLARFHVSRGRVLRCLAIGMGLEKAVRADKMKDTMIAKKPENSKGLLGSGRKSFASNGRKHKKQSDSMSSSDCKGGSKKGWGSVKKKRTDIAKSGVDRLPDEWMNPLGADQSTRRISIETFWRNLVARHAYRPARFWFDGAEPLLRHTEAPDHPITESEAIKIILDGGGRSVYNDGRKRKFLFADKVGKDIKLSEAAASVGYQFVQLRTPRRKESAERTHAYVEKEKKKIVRSKRRGRRRSSVSTSGDAARAAALFQ